MRRGGKLIGTAAMLSVVACGGEQGKLQIRTTASPLTAGHQPMPLRIAEARGQFALGNVGLALEAFRKALREDPNSIDALMGVAACYDQMARFDLSRRHYESALAIAPANPQLLAAFAASLDLQGRKTEAASVRAEIHQRIAVAARQSSPQPAPLPTARLDPVNVASVQAPALPKPLKSAQPLPRNVSVEPEPAPRSIPDVPAKPARTAEDERAPTAAPRPAVITATARSVTVALPPAQPSVPKALAVPPVEKAATPGLPPTPTMTPPPMQVAARNAAVASPSPATPVMTPPARAPAVEKHARIPILATVPVPAAAPVPAIAPVPAPVSTASSDDPVRIARTETHSLTVPIETDGPRLERTSLREVALITTPAPQWRALMVKRTQRSATVKFVPLRQASINLSNIRLLNAARVDRLAARTRSFLVERGWSPMAIGDAPAIRARSVIFFPPERRRTAQRLSAQFGFVMTPRPGSRQITVLLGRDAARVSALRASG